MILAPVQNVSQLLLQDGTEHPPTPQHVEDLHLVGASIADTEHLQSLQSHSRIWDRLFDELQPHSRIALSSTCRFLRQWSKRAYEVVGFRPNQSLHQLIDSISRLVDVLHDKVAYTEVVRTINIQGWNPDSADEEDILRLNLVLATFLARVPALETLVLSMHGLAVPILGRCLHVGFLHGHLGNLRHVSVDMQLSASMTNALFAGFSLSGVASLRLVVNHYGQWVEGFSPYYIHTLGTLVPGLEELVLDQFGMLEASPFPGDLHAWAQAFRSLPHLRLLALASLFVIDLHAECAYEDDEVDTLNSMAIDSDEGSLSPMDTTEDDVPSSTFDYNICMLAAWADTFLDEYLRLPPPFSELWFLGIHLPSGSPGHSSVSGGGVGYRQKITREVEGEKDIVHFMITPATRSTWWWDDLENAHL